MRHLPVLACLALPLLLAVAGGARVGDDRPLPPLPGSNFQSPTTQRLEADDAANPGLLWVEQGQQLWSTAEGSAGKSCASCHGATAGPMRGVAARYPAVDARSGELFNLEQRINSCRTRHMAAPALVYESNELLALTAFVTAKSNGIPRHVAVDGPAAPFFERGRAFFTERQGQLNLACAQCHSERVGARLRGDTISQGQIDGWPAYRLEWNSLGSLHRRLRACSLGVRAEVLDYGSPEYVALELYLAWRGEGLPIKSPGVRR
jgi:sulfur-oxidizing protein SoxA